MSGSSMLHQDGFHNGSSSSLLCSLESHRERHLEGLRYDHVRPFFDV